MLNEIHVFSNSTSCRLVNSYRRFGAAYYHHLQGLVVLDWYTLKMEAVRTFETSVPFIIP